MAPTTTFFSTRDVDTSSDSAVPTPAPSVPIWVAYVVAFLVLCAILVLCYFLRKFSCVVERCVACHSERRAQGENLSSVTKRLKVISGRATSTTSPPPPGTLASAEGVRLPDSRYALGHITRFNTLKNQRDAAQVFAKPHRTVDAAPLPPTLCPAEGIQLERKLNVTNARADSSARLRI
ncbi:hypothetical protein B0H12DRAFT_1081026 [Mycena haematopus]|nr:hypothetical protein B0H12DRAFT_1081026 [Mycena haematopus]